MSSDTPALASSSGDSWRWVVEAGWQASDLAVADVDQAGDQLQRVAGSGAGRRLHRPLLTPKFRMPEARPPMYFWTSG